MKQSKVMSMLETCLNTAIGFVVALATQILVFPLFGYSPPLSTNFKIGLIFTVVSIMRGFVLRRMFEALHIRRPLSPFLQAVIAERFRQPEVEGFDAAHDDDHEVGELATAGAAYAKMASWHLTQTAHDPVNFNRKLTLPNWWPWSADWWKPTGFRRDLVKATALIVAEGEKFDRARKRRSAS